jgi:hypothetical protein
MQPAQPGQPAQAAGFLKSRRGWLGYEARRAKAGYFGRLLTALVGLGQHGADVVDFLW